MTESKKCKNNPQNNGLLLLMRESQKCLKSFENRKEMQCFITEGNKKKKTFVFLSGSLFASSFLFLLSLL